MKKLTQEMIKLAACWLLTMLITTLLTSTAAGQAFFQIETTTTNTSGHITTIDNSHTNGKQNHIIVVTPVYGKYVKAAVGVWYNGGKWKIYTEDRSAMPIGTKFNVMVMPKGANAFIATQKSNTNFIDLEGVAKGDVLIATHVYRRGGYHTSPVGVYQHQNRTILYNEMGEDIPLGMEFNVVVVSKLSAGKSFVHRTQSRSSHISSMNETTEADKNKLVFTTVSLEVPGRYNKTHTGVWYNANQWKVYNQDRQKLANDVLFNVYVVNPTYNLAGPIVINPGGPILVTDPIDIPEYVEPVKEKRNVLLPFMVNRSNIKYVERNGLAIYQDDIILGSAREVVQRRPSKHPVRPDFKTKYDRGNYGDISSQSAALTAVGTALNEDWGECLWNFGIIPYEFDPTDNWTATERSTVERHINKLNRETNLRLVPRNGHTDYIEIEKNSDFPNDGGYAAVGRRGGGQDVVIGSTSERMVIHEILHAAGFWHEQSRPDRDRHVRILRENIDTGKGHNFDKHEDSRPLTPYDFASIMHYSSTAFGSGNTTLQARSSSYRGPIGGNRLSDLDVDGINLLYPQDARTLVTPPLRATRNVTMTVKRLEAKSGTDGCGEVEFFSKMEIGAGHTWRAWARGNNTLRRQSGSVEGRLILPNWTHTGSVGTGVNTAKVVLQLKEDDSGLCFADDWVDANPLNGLMELQLMVNMVNGEIWIWDQERNRRADYVGQAGTDIPLQGFETRDSDDDESIPVHILFRIDIRR